MKLFRDKNEEAPVTLYREDEAYPGKETSTLIFEEN